jgi:hypothetical protein
VETCGKSYGTEGALKMHLKLKHPNVDYEYVLAPELQCMVSLAIANPTSSAFVNKEVVLSVKRTNSTPPRFLIWMFLFLRFCSPMNPPVNYKEMLKQSKTFESDQNGLGEFDLDETESSEEKLSASSPTTSLPSPGSAAVTLTLSSPPSTTTSVASNIVIPALLQSSAGPGYPTAGMDSAAAASGNGPNGMILSPYGASPFMTSPLYGVNPHLYVLLSVCHDPTSTRRLELFIALLFLEC